MSEFLTGLDVALDRRLPLLQHARIGLLANQASVGRDLRPAWELIAEYFPGRLAAVFSPQHGLWSEQQANMIESPHGQLADLNIPVHSLYSETRRPTRQMLDNIDLFAVDLQDVGSRIYTFIWTMTNCLRACAASHIPVVILDRPNPLGGAISGPILQDKFHSFVGMAPLPLEHDLTIAEVALFVNRVLSIGAQVEVVRMENWRRSKPWPTLDRTWIPPSPNLPTTNGVRVYPGQVLLEGTNVSEGRGTTCPFEIVGAPWIDGARLAAQCHRLGCEGVSLRPIRFVPMFDKWAGQSCGGLFLHPRCDRFSSVRTAVVLIAAIAKLWPEHFRWLDPPYEYERTLPPIDILFGSDALRLAVAALDDNAAIIERLDGMLRFDPRQWRNASEFARLYEE